MTTHDTAKGRPAMPGGPCRMDDQPFSVTVVLGLRCAVPLVTYRPEIALRYAVPELRFAPDSVTLVRGCRAAAAPLMYRPVIALR